MRLAVAALSRPPTPFCRCVCVEDREADAAPHLVCDLRQWAYFALLDVKIVFGDDVGEICRRDDAVLYRLHALAGERRDGRHDQVGGNICFFDQDGCGGPIDGRPKDGDADSRCQEHGSNPENAPFFTPNEGEILPKMTKSEVAIKVIVCLSGHCAPEGPMSCISRRRRDRGSTIRHARPVGSGIGPYHFRSMCFGAVAPVIEIATCGPQEMVRSRHSERVARDMSGAPKIPDALSSRNSCKSVGIVLTEIRVTGPSQVATMRAFRGNFDYHLRLGPACPERWQVTARRLVDGKVTILISPCCATHVSKRNLGGGDWVLATFELHDRPAFGPYNREVAAISNGWKASGSPAGGDPFSTQRLSDGAASCPSPDGQRAIFVSNWGDKTGPVADVAQFQ